MALRWGGGERLPPAGSGGGGDGGVVNLLSDEEGEEGGAPELQAPAPAQATRSRRLRLQQPPALEALLHGVGAAGEALLEEQRDRDRGIVRFENQKLFSEFVEFCATLTEENPEVINFLQRKYSKAFPDYLASTEFRNVLGRCLTRVQGKKSKVFVYINELCTALKANSQKIKLALANRGNSKQPLEQIVGQSDKDAKQLRDCPGRTSAQSGDSASTSVPQPADTVTVEKKRSGTGSKRQIRYLENLLKVYADEIKRLQERELDLNELEDEDSSYIQEHRLKKKMVKIFEKLCELKNCSNLTGRVIEQRISFTGTRYPEINRKIEKFINKPDHFPDYQDIRNIMHKVSTRHTLGLSQRQIQSMAQDVFREVGNRLQERRHLDLVYNFGSHLTDDYKPNKDPAMADITLERRLRSNRSVALGRLNDVVKKYAEIQDVGEIEEEEKRKKKKLLQSAVTSTSEASKPETKNVKEEQEELQKVEESEGKKPKEEEMEEQEEVAGSGEEEDDEEEEEDEDDEDDLSSDPDIEEELSKIEEVIEAEEEPQEDEKAETSEVEEVEDQSEESAQSSDEEDDSEDDADSVEDQVEGGMGLDNESHPICTVEEDVDSNNESSPVCTVRHESESNNESGNTRGEKVGGDDGNSPANSVEEGVGSSNESGLVPPVEEGVGSSSESGAVDPVEEGVGSSSESGAVNTVEEGVGSSNMSGAVSTVEGRVGSGAARSLDSAVKKRDQSDYEDSPVCAVEEGIGSDGTSPDHEEGKEELGEQLERRAKRKRADSSGQKLETQIVKPNPKTPSKADEDISADEEKVTNNLSAHKKCDAETSPYFEPKSLTTKDETNLDKRPVIKKESLDMLGIDRQSPDICLTAVNGKKKDSIDQDDSPVAKKVKREADVEKSGVEVIELMESDEGIEEPLMDCAVSGVGVKSPLPAVDSTRADSPLVSVVTSSQPSPVNVATQCDPEEIIVLSDSD
ncbi:death domain-associated protein 6-like isoform X2 [Heptranchias perlo]|uniref:death domain-associated protein 6-like isoform X2 n=1 Tax=Heptranchias perlo TaxID=212740 RepID=UPI00355A50D4